MVSRENRVTAAFVALSLPVAFVVLAIADDVVGGDAASAISFAAMVLVAVAAPQAYLRYVRP